MEVFTRCWQRTRAGGTRRGGASRRVTSRHVTSRRVTPRHETFLGDALLKYRWLPVVRGLQHDALVVRALLLALAGAQLGGAVACDEQLQARRCKPTHDLRLSRKRLKSVFTSTLFNFCTDNFFQNYV